MEIIAHFAHKIFPFIIINSYGKRFSKSLSTRKRSFNSAEDRCRRMGRVMRMLHME